MRTTRLALLALSLAAQPVRADLIIPSDFTVTNGWGFNRCLPASSANVCINGVAYYGQSATTGLFGVTYDFWSNIYGTVPPSTILAVGMYQIVFHSVDDPSACCVALGTNYPFTPGVPLTSGQFYSPRLTANSTIFSTQAYWSAHTIVDGKLVWAGDAYGPVSVSPTPEPSTFGFVALGLFTVGFMRRRRRRTMAIEHTAEL